MIPIEMFAYLPPLFAVLQAVFGVVEAGELEESEVDDLLHTLPVIHLLRHFTPSWKKRLVFFKCSFNVFQM